MYTRTEYDRPDINFEQMKTFMSHGWGPTGARVAAHWMEFNQLYFDGKLQPIPICIVQSPPYGHWLGCTACNMTRKRAHLIQLSYPKGTFKHGRHYQPPVLVADRATLLHEMIHQHLVELGKDPGHDTPGWCAEVMRLHRVITGVKIWAAQEKIGKTKMVDGHRSSRRYQPKDPETGATSLDWGSIARWPIGKLATELGPL